MSLTPIKRKTQDTLCHRALLGLVLQAGALERLLPVFSACPFHSLFIIYPHARTYIVTINE